MTKKILVFPKNYTFYKIKKHVKKDIKSVEDNDYIYIVDNVGKFEGFFPLTMLYDSPGSKVASEASKKFLDIVVGIQDKKESVVSLALKHDVSSVPVVDEKGILKGSVIDTKILQILHKKHAEDLFSLSGIDKSHTKVESILNISIFESIKHRFLWLLIGLFGGLLAAEIIGFFETTLETHIILAAFIPLVVYMADAVGTQLEAFSIRDFALFKKIDFSKYFWRQIQAVFIIAILLGISSGIVSYFISNDFHVSLVISIAIFIATFSSIITGLLIPFIFRKLKKDPANASGPIGTIIQDLMSVVIYFIIAKLLLI